MTYDSVTQNEGSDLIPKSRICKRTIVVETWVELGIQKKYSVE